MVALREVGYFGNRMVPALGEGGIASSCGAPGSLGWYRLGLSVLERLGVTPAPASEDGRAEVEYWGDRIIVWCSIHISHAPLASFFMLVKSVRMMRGTFGESG